jgi:hypothetical protein
MRVKDEDVGFGNDDMQQTNFLPNIKEEEGFTNYVDNKKGRRTQRFKEQENDHKMAINDEERKSDAISDS